MHWPLSQVHWLALQLVVTQSLSQYSQPALHAAEVSQAQLSKASLSTAVNSPNDDKSPESSLAIPSYMVNRLLEKVSEPASRRTTARPLACALVTESLGTLKYTVAKPSMLVAGVLVT